MMLHQIDFDPELRQMLPTVPTCEELTAFQNTPDRHNAYANMWRMVTFVGVLANTAMWIGI